MPPRRHASGSFRLAYTRLVGAPLLPLPIGEGYWLRGNPRSITCCGGLSEALRTQTAAAKRRGVREFWRPTTPRANEFAKKEKGVRNHVSARSKVCKAPRDRDQAGRGFRRSTGLVRKRTVPVLALRSSVLLALIRPLRLSSPDQSL
jgi:hypothetical protein